MPRWLQLTIFLSVALTLNVGLHWYLWARLVRGTGLPRPWRQLATGWLVLFAAGLPAIMGLSRVMPPKLARVLTLPVYVWMGVLFFLMVGLLAGDLGLTLSSIARRTRGAPPLDQDRRQFVARLVGGAVAVGTVGTSVFAIRSALGRVEVKEVRIPLARLSTSQHGFTIVQLTDVHIGPTLGKDWLEGVVAQVNALAPDLIAITGDLVDGKVDNLRASVAPLAGLKSKHGTFFVTGNHEYYSGAEEWMPELERLGIRVLRNERVSIGVDGPEGFDLVGIDDYMSRGMAAGHGPDLPRALAGRDPSRELVLLAHQPKAVLEASKHGVGLQLSGHTHGGQLWPWTYLVYLQQPYVRGLAVHDGTWIYVSCGTGFWGPPMRFNAPAEITKVVLERLDTGSFPEQTKS